MGPVMLVNWEARTCHKREEMTRRMVIRDRPGEETDLASVRREGTEAEGKEWYSPDELWRWLGLGLTKTYELLQSGEIPSYKIGRVRRIRGSVRVSV